MGTNRTTNQQVPQTSKRKQPHDEIDPTLADLKRQRKNNESPQSQPLVNNSTNLNQSRDPNIESNTSSTLPGTQTINPNLDTNTKPKDPYTYLEDYFNGKPGIYPN